MTLRCQSRTTPRASTSAPFSSRNFTISGWLCAAAHISADLPAPGFLRVDVGTGLDQQLGGVDVAGARDDHQRRLAFGVRAIRIRRRPSSSALMIGVGADDRGFRQRGRAVVVRRVDVGAGLDAARRRARRRRCTRPTSTRWCRRLRARSRRRLRRAAAAPSRDRRPRARRATSARRGSRAELASSTPRRTAATSRHRSWLRPPTARRRCRRSTPPGSACARAASSSKSAMRESCG